MTYNQRSFLVTGGTGFIGHAIVALIKQRFGQHVTVIVLDSSCDLRRDTAFTTFANLANNHSFDHVIHLAAKAPSGEWLARNPAQGWYENTLINATLFEGVRRYFPQAKVTSVLSYSMYPQSEYASAEDQIPLRNSNDNLAAYANSKIGILTAQEAYKQQYDLKSASVVLSTVYGPSGAKPNTGQVIPALCEKFLLAARSSSPVVELWGSGKQERDFLFIRDAADGILKSALKQESPVLNLGSGAFNTISDVAILIAEMTGYTGRISYDETQYSGPQRRWLNIDQAKKELGWFPQKTLKEGLALMIADMRKYVSNQKI